MFSSVSIYRLVGWLVCFFVSRITKKTAEQIRYFNGGWNRSFIAFRAPNIGLNVDFPMQIDIKAAESV